MELTKEQIEFLDKVVVGIWTLNSGGEVDVDDSVYMDSMNLTEIPVKFGEVNRNFVCSDNNLTTLKNSPNYVGRNFYIFRNKLTSLEFLPTSISGGDPNGFLYFQGNPLTDYFKNLNGEDFPHWKIIDFNILFVEYPFLIKMKNIEFSRIELSYILNSFPQTKIYLN